MLPSSHQAAEEAAKGVGDPQAVQQTQPLHIGELAARERHSQARGLALAGESRPLFHAKLDHQAARPLNSFPWNRSMGAMLSRSTRLSQAKLVSSRVSDSIPCFLAAARSLPPPSGLIGIVRAGQL